MERERLENLVDEVNIDRKHWRTDLVTEILSELAKEKTASGELVEELRAYTDNITGPRQDGSATRLAIAFNEGAKAAGMAVKEILSRYSARKEVVLGEGKFSVDPEVAEVVVSPIDNDIMIHGMGFERIHGKRGKLIFVEEDTK